MIQWRRYKRQTGVLCTFCFVLLGLGYHASVQAETEVVTIRHFQSHERYRFGLELLDLAMKKTGVPYRIVPPPSSEITEARGEREVLNGRLDLEFLSTNTFRERAMLPIRIPVYRGLLGMRLLLVRPDKAAEISRVRSRQELARYTALHGYHWGDLPVYAANGLPVATNTKYESLFQMLLWGRGDYFHRGVSEIWIEWEKYKDQLVIADDIALFYPHPVYFFVGKHRPELADYVETGLKKALEDGSFKALFFKEYQDVLDKSRLQDRHIIRLENPVLPDPSLVIDTSWWMPSSRP